MVVAAAVVWAIGVLTAERVVGGALLDFSSTLGGSLWFDEMWISVFL